jgi:mannose-6-phosphate isomerase-like protein (cupin superfamily)
MLRELLHPDKADLAIRYSLAHAVVKPGLATTSHILKTTEVYYIMEGEGIMHINEEII